MDESIRKALEEKFNVKPKVEVKASATEESLHVESETEVKESIADENINVDPELDPELEKKIMSFFESATSDKEIWESLLDATYWLMEEKNYKDEDRDVAWEYVCQVLEKNHIKVPEEGGWCSIVILIAITSTLSLYFVM